MPLLKQVVSQSNQVFNVPTPTEVLRAPKTISRQFFRQFWRLMNA
jgi:hypothetical protein